MDVRKQILEAADALFHRIGIRSITMDDIARELSMSKKTLYKHFSNKADIVKAVSLAHMEWEQSQITQIHDNATNPVEEIFILMRWIGDAFKEVNPTLIYDLRKYYPESWALFSEFRMGFMRDMLKESLEKGIEQGLFRPELDVDIISRYRTETIEMLFNPEVFPPDKYDAASVQLHVLDHFVHGIVTQKGKAMLDGYRQDYENNKISSNS